MKVGSDKPPFGRTRRHFLHGMATAGIALAAGACGPDSAAPPTGNPGPSPSPTPTPTPTPPPLAPRSWKMGFSPTAPQPTVASVLAGIDNWSRRAELAIIHEQLPWDDLMAGMSAADILQRDKVELVRLFRTKGLGLVFMLDLTDGLDRSAEAPALVAAGRSLAEPAIQALAIDYALAVETMLAPQMLGLAAETNLVRDIAAPATYAALRTAANAIEAALANAQASAPRFISVQAEHAWGGIGNRGAFAGIDRDLADFAFTGALGISSYPYFSWAEPEDLPADYYSRLRGSSGLPVLVTEGGWTSASALGASVQSSPAKQARYFARHAQLLDSVAATAYFQLLYADLDLSAFPPPIPANLPLFAEIGLASASFAAKPALAAWDGLHARPLA